MITCAKKQVPVNTIDADMQYYPTTSGKYVVYDVDSIVYTEIPRDTIIYSYRIREKIADSYTDNTGRPAIRLERSIKKPKAGVTYDSIPWSMKEVWMVNSDQQKIQVMESNIRFTKLVFPVVLNQTWNGNASNTQDPWIYRYEYVNRPETINGKPMDKVLMVNQKSDSSAIAYLRYSEKYAAGIGLVYREMTELFSNKVVTNEPVTSRIENGFIYRQTFVTFGYE
jgi:hypothetical protein